MSRRELRNRVERLARNVQSKAEQNKDPGRYFKIDPELAKALQHDLRRLGELWWERNPLEHIYGTGVTEEEHMLRARIVERASTITCPAAYDFEEFRDDRARLQYFYEEEWPPWHEDLKLNNVNDPEATAAQIIARIEAFKQTPEGRGRMRLDELEKMAMSPAEYAEFDRLLTLYPEPSCYGMPTGKDSDVTKWRDVAQRRIDAQEAVRRYEYRMRSLERYEAKKQAQRD